MDTSQAQAQAALHPYAQRAQNASTSGVPEAPPAQFAEALRPDLESHNYLVQRFGDKYTQLVERYGVAEIVHDAEGNIVDVASPEEYLEESDRRILHGLATNSYDQETAALIPTPKVLHQLALAETSLIASIVYQLRAEPEYLRSVVETSTFHRPELVHDAHGKAPDVKDLLSNAQCMALEFRYTVHNTLLELGQWALISQYLKDVCDLEEKSGYVKSREERTRLMNAARDVTEQAMEVAAKRTGRAVTRHPKFEKYFVRSFDHVPKWTGSALETVQGPEMDSLLESRNLHGALFRFCFIANMEFLEQLSITKDLVKEFSQATPAQHEELGDHLVDCVSRVKSFWDFYQVLGFRDKTEPYFDSRLVQFRDNSVTAQKILDAAPIERYIKSIASLGNENAVQKIWVEIDKLTKKRVSRTIEKLIGYEKPAPRWYIAPRTRVPVRPPTPTDVAVPVRRPPRTPPASSEPVEEPEPVKLTPYSYLGAMRLEAIETVEDEPIVVRVGPKVKRTGVPDATVRGVEGPPAAPAELGPQPTEGAAGTAIFNVRRWAYEVFEKIFDFKVRGVLKQGDFIQAMTHIGFSMEQSAGSRFTMRPPQGNQPFKDHRLHGGDLEMNIAHRRRCAKRLKEDYGWSLESFRVVS